MHPDAVGFAGYHGFASGPLDEPHRVRWAELQRPVLSDESNLGMDPITGGIDMGRQSRSTRRRRK